ncbi:MAG: AI-2E family transporter [Clostridia bacterium]|nr:AI-2E family transporter [Clostridia bacterium]
MAEFEDRRDEDPAPKKPKLTIKHITAAALVGILIVLTLSNWDAVLRPFKTLSSILAPITIGLVLAYIANFILRFFEYKLFNKVKKRTVNRAISMLLTYLLLLVFIGGVIWLIVPSVVDSVQDLQANGMSYVTRVINSINEFVKKIPFIQPEDGEDFLNLEKVVNFVIEIIGSSGSWIVSNLASIAGSAMTVLKNIIVGIFISIYVLLSKERLNAGCRRVFRALFSDKNEKVLLRYFSTAHNKFGGYMIGKLLDSTMVMLVCLLLFTVFKIPYAVLIAVIIGVTDIIPFFGPFIGAIPSAIIIFIASPMKAVVFVLLILVVQQIDGNLIAPMILGDKTGLTSLGVIVAVTVMGGVLGLTGLLIGVPLFALLMTILDDFIKHRLREKGCDTDIKKYYPADAFIRPQDEIKTDETLTQRFVRWVRTVETEEEGVDYDPSPLHSFGCFFRRGFLAVGRFFQRLFSIKPIPADHTGGIFTDIAKHGMRSNRHFWRTFLYSIITLGIYPFYVVEVIAQSTNIACNKDGNRTWGFFPYLILAICTLGIFPIVWHCRVITRFQHYAQENGKTCCVTKKFYLLWTVPGFLTVVGPLIALARFLRAFSDLCETYNATHTFPLSEEEKRIQEDRLNASANRPKARKSLIDQMISEPITANECEDEEEKREETFESYPEESPVPPTSPIDEDEVKTQ